MNCKKCGVKAHSELCFRCKPNKQIKRTEIKKKVYVIAKRSKKRQRQEKEYLVKRKEFLAKFPMCEFNGCEKEANTIHHSRGRIGGLLTNEKYFVSLCMEHHQFIELNPQFAKDNGYSESRLAKDSNVKF